MRFFWTVLALIAFLFCLPETGKAQTEFGATVDKESVGVYKIWKENEAILEKRFEGFVEYANKDTGRLTGNPNYFANYISVQNQDQREEQLARGCDQGFFRCLTPGTKLRVEISMHKPLNANKDQEEIDNTINSDEEPEPGLSSTKNCKCKDNDLTTPWGKGVIEENWLLAPRFIGPTNLADEQRATLRDSLRCLRDSLRSLEKQLKAHIKQAEQANSRANSGRAKKDVGMITYISKKIIGPKYTRNISVNMSQTSKLAWAPILIVIIGILGGALYENRRYLRHEVIFGRSKKHIGKRIKDRK